jgi:alanine racemase
MLGVVKADAYGHGAVPVARALEDAGIDMFGVALVEEGVELRAAGIRKPILVMGITPAEEIETALAHDLAATVDDVATARELERVAAAHGRTVRVHLKVDTGMNRLGVRAEQATEAAAGLVAMKHLALEGAYTHFACADCDEDTDEAANAEQVRRLRAALAGMRSAGVCPPLVHAANSAAILRLPHTHLDMVRSGLALYGIHPGPGPKNLRSQISDSSEDLRPALALKSRVVHVKRVARGEGVSYGHRWRAARDSLIGVVPAGYADGYRRALSNRSQVRVAGRLCPVVGTVCMDATMVDLTDVSDARPGLEATLIEADAGSPLSAAAIASLCDTIPYEILTGLSRRVPRVYV